MPFTGLFLWLGLGIGALVALGGAVQWVRLDAIADYRRQVEAETAVLLAKEEAKRSAIIAESKREAEAENAEDVERERLLAEANTRISQLEAVKPKGCVISRETVRELNGRR